MELKMSLVDNSNERVINVNEMGMMAYMPVIGIERSQAIIVNYMQNNAFSGENINGYGIADNLKLDRIITRRKDGVLDGTTREFLYNCKYETYIVDISDEARKTIKENMGQFVSYEFLYETIFGKKMYTKDQIAVTEGLTPVIDTYKLLEYEQDIIKNKYEVVVPDSIRYDENGIGIIDTLEAVYITSKYTPEIILTVPEEAHEDYISRQEPYKLLLYMTKKGGFI
jgi:hypothetical protein